MSSASRAAPRAAQAAAPPARRPDRRRLADRIALVTALLVPTAVTVWGWQYYVAPLGARLRHDLHGLLRPSGTVGLALGIVALAGFLFLWLYPLRKGLRALAWMGTLGDWLRVHIVFGLSVPLYAAVHAGWRFDGLIGLGYLSMFIVALSGLVGRYLYTHIPRSQSGVELSREEVANQRRSLITDIAAATGRPPLELESVMRVAGGASEALGPLGALRRLLQDDFERRRAISRLRLELAQPRPGRAAIDGRSLGRALGLARQELALSQQVRMLDATRRVFALWHVAHRPFAITALLAVSIHVVVAVLFAGIGAK